MLSGMEAKVRQPAPPAERFDARAFDGSVGHEVTVHAAEGSTRGRLVAATVVDDGDAVEFTLDVPDGLAAQLRTAVLPVTVSEPIKMQDWPPLTAGRLRTALNGLPDDWPVMVAYEGHVERLHGALIR